MRMFVAVLPPEEAREDLEEFLAPWRQAAGFRWTLSSQWHLTLAFLAEVPDRAVEDLHERLARAAGRRTTTPLRIGGGGAFPHPAAARVLWTGVEATDPDREELRRMAVGTRSAAAKAGVEVAGGRFRPHLTLARTGGRVEASRWVRLLEGYRGPSWRVDRLTLIASHLGQGPDGRPRYEPLASFPLRARNADIRGESGKER